VRTETSQETVVVEIRAAEGGEDAKLLVKTQLEAYVNAAAKQRL
jgi:protein subunit release factor A